MLSPCHAMPYLTCIEGGCRIWQGSVKCAAGAFFYCTPLFYSSVDELALSMYPPMNHLAVRLNVSFCSLHAGLLTWL